MKKTILRALQTGKATTRRYQVKDLENYLFIIKGLFIDTETGIKANEKNSFWTQKNANRADLIRDIMWMQYRKPTDTHYYTMLNRCANGDGYGNDYHTTTKNRNK